MHVIFREAAYGLRDGFRVDIQNLHRRLFLGKMCCGGYTIQTEGTSIGPVSGFDDSIVTELKPYLHGVATGSCDPGLAVRVV
jgi:hypothetical protein